MKLSFYSMCQYNGYGLHVADISIQENTKSMNGIFLTIKKENITWTYKIWVLV